MRRDAPAALLLSGPAGGVRAAAEVAAACGYPDAVSFDMGGTSTDVCLVRGGVPEPAPERVGRRASRSGCPRSTSTRSARAAGRSPRIDAGGALVVGPRSAGAVPGPGVLRPRRRRADRDRRRPRARPHPRRSRAFPGARPARRRRGARARSNGRASTADGVVARGRRRDGAGGAARSPSSAASIRVELALVAFGGAGPLHACAIADALGMRAVIVPPRAGVCSAVGLLCAPAGTRGRAAASARRIAGSTTRSRASPRDAARSVGDGAHGRDRGRLPLRRPEPRAHRRDARRLPGRARTPQRARASRRAGRGRSRCGRARRSPAPLRVTDLPDVDRAARVVGPAVVAEPDCTVWVPDGWVAPSRARSARGS